MGVGGFGVACADDGTVAYWNYLMVYQKPNQFLLRQKWMQLNLIDHRLNPTVSKQITSQL